MTYPAELNLPFIPELVKSLVEFFVGGILNGGGIPRHDPVRIICSKSLRSTADVGHNLSAVIVRTDNQFGIDEQGFPVIFFYASSYQKLIVAVSIKFNSVKNIYSRTGNCLYQIFRLPSLQGHNRYLMP